jgi:type IV pilus assembly protein PilW
MKYNVTKQRGITLIELMVAAALGVVLTTAVINIVIVSNKTSAQADGLAQAQETGRFVAGFLTDALADAGYSGERSTDILAPHANACAAPDFNVPAGCTINRDDQTGDRITVQRRITNGDDLDCTGSSLNLAPGIDEVVIDSFWVEGNGVDTGELYCQTFRDDGNDYGRQKSVIADGVIAMHALYGYSDRIDADPNGNRDVSIYVAPEDLPLDPAGNPDWARVYSVKISILVQSFEEVSIADKNRGFILLDANPFTLRDRFQRQVFTTTIARANFSTLTD